MVMQTSGKTAQPWPGSEAWDLVEAVVQAGGVPGINDLGAFRVLERTNPRARPQDDPRMAWRLIRDEDGQTYGFGGRGLSRLVSADAGFLPSDGAVLAAEYPVFVYDTLTAEGAESGPGGGSGLLWVAAAVAGAKALHLF